MASNGNKGQQANYGSCYQAATQLNVQLVVL